MSSLYTCRRGWIVSQSPEDGSMVPFFINTRLDDVHITPFKIKNWTIKKYANNFIEGNHNVLFNQGKFNSVYTNADGEYKDLWKYICMFPYAISLDTFSFNVNIDAKSDRIKNMKSDIEVIYDKLKDTAIGVVITGISTDGNFTIDDIPSDGYEDIEYKYSRVFVSIQGEVVEENPKYPVDITVTTNDNFVSCKAFANSNYSGKVCWIYDVPNNTIKLKPLVTYPNSSKGNISIDGLS